MRGCFLGYRWSDGNITVAKEKVLEKISSARWYDNLDLTIQGSHNGSILYTQTISVSTASSQLFNFDFAGIDTLTFLAAVSKLTTDQFNCGSFNCTQFNVDDLTIMPAEVPVPAAGLLFFSAFGGLIPAFRRRK